MGGGDKSFFPASLIIFSRSIPLVLPLMDWVGKRLLRERYDQGARGYLELHGEEQLLKYKLALENLSLDSKDLVADFGCGIGLFLKVVEGRVGGVVGLNLSLEELKRAKDLVGGSAHLVQGDIELSLIHI